MGGITGTSNYWTVANLFRMQGSLDCNLLARFTSTWTNSVEVSDSYEEFLTVKTFTLHTFVKRSPAYFPKAKHWTNQCQNDKATRKQSNSGFHVPQTDGTRECTFIGCFSESVAGANELTDDWNTSQWKLIQKRQSWSKFLIRVMNVVQSRHSTFLIALFPSRNKNWIANTFGYGIFHGISYNELFCRVCLFGL